MNAQHQGVGMGGGCAPSRTECEVEGNLWFKNENAIKKIKPNGTLFSTYKRGL